MLGCSYAYQVRVSLSPTPHPPPNFSSPGGGLGFGTRPRLLSRRFRLCTHHLCTCCPEIPQPQALTCS